MKFEVLGPMEVYRRGQAVSLQGTTSRCLLGVLLSRPGRPVGASELVDALWPVDPPANAVPNLRSYVSKLRRSLAEPDRIMSGAAGYTLRVAPGELDATKFVEEIQQAQRTRIAGDLSSAEELLDKALNRWQGDPYGGLEECRYLEPERQRLTEWRLRALGDRAEILLRLGRHADLLPELSALNQAYPDNERFTAQLMLALHRSKRPQDALEVFQTLRDRLVEDYGREPDKPLHELYGAIVRSDRALDVETAAAEPAGKATAPANRESGTASEASSASHGEGPRYQPSRDAEPVRAFRRITWLWPTPRRRAALTGLAAGLLLVGAALGTQARDGWNLLSADTTSREQAHQQGPNTVSGDSRLHGRPSAAPDPTVPAPTTRRRADSRAPASRDEEAAGTHSRSTTHPSQPGPDGTPKSTTSALDVQEGATGWDRCGPAPRMFSGPSELQRLLDTNSPAIDNAPESVEKVRLLLQSASEHVVNVHGLRVRVQPLDTDRQIRAFEEQRIDTGCGATVDRDVPLSLSQFEPGVWTELSTLDDDGLPTLEVSASDSEALLIDLTDLEELSGTYQWEIQVKWSTAGMEAPQWEPTDATYLTSAADLYSYTHNGTVTRDN